jgi:phosphatidylserine/phosphatidylglycerophosphate/cardiolipin synthase-like enzyme
MKEQPTPKPYFVHTKTWIVDDQAVIVGSANYWDRSMVGDDTELGVAIVSGLSENGLTFGHALRVRLWNRLLKAIPGAGVVSAKPTMVDELPALAGALERL